MAQNYTPIDDFIKQQTGNDDPVHLSSPVQDTQAQSDSSDTLNEPISLSKEAEPGGSALNEILPVQETVEKQEVEPDVKPFVSVKPQKYES